MMNKKESLEKKLRFLERCKSKAQRRLAECEEHFLELKVQKVLCEEETDQQEGRILFIEEDILELKSEIKKEADK